MVFLLLSDLFLIECDRDSGTIMPDMQKLLYFLPCAFCQILFSFSRLSCDMSPEALAYAVLSDRAIWDRDLRDVPGLEDLVAAQLRDLQLLGLREALKKACGN